MNFLGDPQPDGNAIYQLAERLFPICRSITGNGVRRTLDIIGESLPGLQTFELPSGTQCFDWTIPREWNITSAWIRDESGKTIVDFDDSNLHVVGYSTPVDQWIELEELQQHLYSLPEQPDAIPYVTSYYRERWGFCLSENQRRQLKPGKYHVKIDSSLSDGSLTYGELLLPGDSNKEIFLSSYICHPSMANNELSGPCVLTYLAKWISSLPSRKYSYRFVLIPETIGSIAYLSQYYQTLKERVIAGFNLSCVGDDRTYSFLESRSADTLADLVATHVLSHFYPEFVRYSFTSRGSDERQYCSPGVDLPVVSIMRTKYGEYPEYHTSLDNMDLISPEGLYGSYRAIALCIMCLEKNCTPKTRVLCEPQLGKRGLYPDLSRTNSSQVVRKMMDLLAYSDGTRNLIEIGNRVNAPAWELFEHVDKLVEHQILEITDYP